MDVYGANNDPQETRLLALELAVVELRAQLAFLAKPTPTPEEPAMSAVPSVPVVPPRAKTKISPSRIGAYLAGLSGIAGAVAVPIANLDTTSTAGVIAGVVAVLTAYLGWVPGWRAHEDRVAQGFGV